MKHFHTKKKFDMLLKRLPNIYQNSCNKFDDDFHKKFLNYKINKDQYEIALHCYSVRVALAKAYCGIGIYDVSYDIKNLGIRQKEPIKNIKTACDQANRFFKNLYNSNK